MKKNQISKLQKKSLFFLLIHGTYHNICRSYKYYSPYISWTGKHENIAEILAANGLWSAALRWGFGNLSRLPPPPLPDPKIRDQICIYNSIMCVFLDESDIASLHYSINNFKFINVARDYILLLRLSMSRNNYNVSMMCCIVR